MFQWLWNHAPIIGAFALGWIGASLRAAHVELRREKLDRWLREQRRVPHA